MFRRKTKTPANPPRNVNQSSRAPVFSYYASRSPAEVPRERGEMPGPRSGLRFKSVLGYLPSLVAGIALMVCLGYISTLSVDANVQLVGKMPEDQSLVNNLSTYQKEFRVILSESPLYRSKLLIDTEEIAKELSRRFPELGDISVVLPLVGRRPVVKVRPAEPAITLSAAGSGPYVVDTKGRVLAYTRDTDSSITDSLPIIRDESGLPVDRGNIVVTADTITFINSVHGQLSHANIQPESLILPQSNAGELHIRPQGKPYFVKFDMRGEGRQQVGAFLAVKAHLEREGKTPAEYIDVRVPGKAFYK